jgi:hypothetical protein
MLSYSKDGLILKIDKMKSFVGFSVETLQSVEELLITGSIIDDFGFIGLMPKLRKLIILACKSDVWQTLNGHDGIRILRLHNLKLGKGRGYLQDIDFVSTFNNLEYLYLKMLDITIFPDLTMLKSLHTIASSNRKLLDYSTLENLPKLNTFIGWPETDNHITPAEAFIPILKNHSLKSFDYIQFNREDAKLKNYVDTYNPNIDYPMTTVDGFCVDNSKTMIIINLFF